MVLKVVDKVPLITEYLIFQSFTEVTRIGMNGARAARPVEEDSKAVIGLVQIRCHPIKAEIVTTWDHLMTGARATASGVEVKQISL